MTFITNDKKIRVLVVDDSALFRDMISDGLSSDPMIEVVAKAVDAYDAKDKILEYQPDVMICDVGMPKMNGIVFIKKLLPQYLIPVIVISTFSDLVFDAMDAGAIDFVGKPEKGTRENINEFIEVLKDKVKIAVNAKVTVAQDKYNGKKYPTLDLRNKGIIAIAASTGGIDAITTILETLPENSPGIIIVQHIPEKFSKLFAERLNSNLPMDVKEAEDGDVLEQGKVIIAPGNKHVRIKKKDDKHIVECFYGEKVNRHRPSADVLFESVANVCKENAIGVILTGMGADGARGLLSMRNKGARTIGQDENSCVVYGMPKVAYEIGAVEIQVPLDEISNTICSLLM